MLGRGERKFFIHPSTWSEGGPLLPRRNPAEDFAQHFYAASATLGRLIEDKFEAFKMASLDADRRPFPTIVTCRSDCPARGISVATAFAHRSMTQCSCVSATS